jgi:hypothetical protein
VDNLSLDSPTAAMDDADFIDAGLPALVKVLLDDAGNIPGRKGVQVDRIFKGNDDGGIKWRRLIRRATFLFSAALGHGIKKGKANYSSPYPLMLKKTRKWKSD